MKIYTVTTEDEIKECFPAFKELRPHLSQDEFISQVLRQMKNHCYEITYIKENDIVVAASGYRVAEYLAWGKIFYLDDLITVSTARHLGYGGTLMNWLIEKAKELSCHEFHLDSGTHRHDAHRLYIGKKLKISSFHFSNTIENLKT